MRGVDSGLTNAAWRDRVLVEVADPRDGTVQRRMTYGQVAGARDRLARDLRRVLPPGAVVGLVAGNTPEWLVADLALLAIEAVEVPVPLAFSAEQASSLLDSPVCLVDEQGEQRMKQWDLQHGRVMVRIDDENRNLAPLSGADAAWETPGRYRDSDIVKIIHTSGTTGAPKGVLIRRAGIESLLGSLATMLPDSAMDRYLSMVPLSLLIEQTAAVYMPVSAGGTLRLLPPDVPLLGTAGSRAEHALAWLHALRPTAAVLPPAVVSALAKAAADAVARGGDAVGELFGTDDAPLLMAGGAPVGADSLKTLAGVGIEVLEGYGLSENTSVVSWNRPGESVPGTVGEPLPHCEVKLGPDDELLVRSDSLFAGYTVEDPTSRPIDEDGWLHTGDRAAIEDGRVSILGRLKNMIITSHGRNISPEWVEGRLRSHPVVRECVVFGDGLEHLVALALTDGTQAADSVEHQIAEFCTDLLAETDRPERVLVLKDEPAVRQRYFTVTGRPRRDLIYREQIAPVLHAETGSPKGRPAHG